MVVICDAAAMAIFSCNPPPHADGLLAAPHTAHRHRHPLVGIYEAQGGFGSSPSSVADLPSEGSYSSPSSDDLLHPLRLPWDFYSSPSSEVLLLEDSCSCSSSHTCSSLSISLSFHNVERCCNYTTLL